MSVRESNFRDYDLGDIAASAGGVYELADGLIPELAGYLGQDGLSPVADEGELRQLIGAVGEFKELQQNIPNIAASMSPQKDRLRLAGDLVLRADVLRRLERNFVVDEPAPRTIDHVVITGGVGRWMERRGQQLEAVAQQTKIGQVHLMTGERKLKPEEGESAQFVIKKMGGDNLATESDFATVWLHDLSAEKLGLNTKHARVRSQKGSEIFAEGIAENEHILDGTIMVIGNAPSTLMTTAEFSMQAIAHRPYFNSNHDQLFMSGDSYRLARTEAQAESPATHQNPYTGLAQVLRNALLLHRASEALKAQSQA